MYNSSIRLGGKSIILPYHKLTSALEVLECAISKFAFSMTVISFYKAVSSKSADSYSINMAGIIKLNPEPSKSSYHTSSTFSLYAFPMTASYPPAFSIFLTLVVIGHPPAKTRINPVPLKCLSKGTQPYVLL